MPDLVSNSFLSWITDINLKIIFSSLIILIIITAVAVGVDYLIRRTLFVLLNKRLKNSQSFLAKSIEEQRVLDSLALILFALVFVFGSFLLVKPSSPLSYNIANFVLKTANLFNLYILTLSINRFIFALHSYYQCISGRADKASWHSYIKIITFFTWAIAIVLSVAYIFGKPPASILTGIGALSAFVLLMFRDTILGIVSSIQANATSLVRVGDWIVIERFNLEGVVEDISITSIKIRNFDNTITTIPTYAITAEAVQNWEYIKSSQARRFQHNIFINPQSIKFVAADFSKKIEKYLSGQEIIVAEMMSNLSYFRLYIKKILEQHTGINQKYSNYCRFENTNNNGLPVLINVYTIDTSTIGHYDLRSELIELFYAALHDFDLEAVKPSASG